MPKLLTVRRIVAVLLAICFVLPLSKCTYPDGHAVAVDTYAYGYDLAKAACDDIREQNLWSGIAVLLAIFTVFFLPFTCLSLRDISQSCSHFAASFPAGYVLYCWVFVFGNAPQYGGIVSILRQWSIRRRISMGA